ncbi:MAG: hypothetical protein HC836_34665 [Richelia sp. RM2_1_2]|nr:hypothetical protein [Richelia sp. RM2_1_2]
MDKLKEKIFETSLSRIWGHFQNHDSAILTAFRHTMINCANEDDSTGENLQTPQNKDRNKQLSASLMKLGYGITKTSGVFIENYNTEAAKQVKEDSYLVVNLKNDPNFVQNIQKLGEHFCQDSVLIVPQGGKGAYLLGTNHSAFPGFGQKHLVGDFKPAIPSDFMSTVDGKRPFHFGEGENYVIETFDRLGNNSKYFVTNISKDILAKIL